MKPENAPEKIYLQIENEYGEEADVGEITWCEHRQHETDIEYKRV